MTLGWASIVPPSEIALLSVTGSTQVTYSAIVMVLGTHILSRSAPQEFFHDRDPKVRHIVAPESTVGVQRRCRDWCASAKENNGIEASGTPRNTVLGWEHPSACTAFGNGWIPYGTWNVGRGPRTARSPICRGLMKKGASQSCGHLKMHAGGHPWNAVLGASVQRAWCVSSQTKGNDARADVPRGKEDWSSASTTATHSIHNLDTAHSLTGPRGCKCHRARRSEA